MANFHTHDLTSQNPRRNKSPEVKRITAALGALAAAERQFSERIAVTQEARAELQEAINAARHVGLSWQTIGDALDLRRGAAYQRYRHRPQCP